MKKKQRLFAFSFGLSLGMHLLALVGFQLSPSFLPKPQREERVVDWLAAIGKEACDEVLKATFERLEEKGVAVVNGEPMEFKAPIPRMEVQREKLTLSPIFWPQQELSKPSTLPTFSISLSLQNHLEALPKDLILSPMDGVAAPLFSPTFVPMALQLVCARTMPSALQHSFSAGEAVVLGLQGRMEKAPAAIAFPDLPRLPTLKELNTVACSEAFDADLVFLPKEEGSGYIFALTLIPKEELELPKIRQHYMFLIDRSNSVQQKRLSATKEAVLLALDEMDPEDTFNIIAFDSKLEKLSPHPMACTEQARRQAEYFLAGVQLGSFLSTPDLYKPLFLTVPGKVEKEESHTVILFTDGEPLKKKAVQRSILFDWTQYNEGRVSLYTVGAHDPQGRLLETAAVMNKGKHWTATTNRAIKRKTSKLMKAIHAPLVKDLCCNAVSHSPETHVRLLNRAQQEPHLYLDQPYVVLGEVDSLDDFTLFVQGRVQDRWIHVRKNVSFLNAKKGTKALKEEWAAKRALELYERYFFEQDGRYLVEAERLLNAADLPPVL
jgi:hypothetical protein